MIISPEGAVPKFFGPDYWDGHMLGDGQMSSEDMDIYEPNFRPEPHIKKLAKLLLREGLGDAVNNEPIRAFDSGQLFDAMTVHEGTFVIFDNERLSRTSLKGEDAGINPDITRLAWRTEAYVSHFHEDLRYVRLMRFGVAVTDRQQKYAKRLVAGRVSDMHIYPDGRCVYTPRTLLGYKPRLPVGQVRHYSSDTHGEIIERVNKVELYRSERPQKERKPAKAAVLGKHVIGWNQS